MIFIELIADAIAGILDSLGGYHYLFSRRFIMPVILGITVSIVSHVWWLGFTVLPVIGTLCLGYFSGENWGRALWLFTQACMIGLPLLFLNHLAWYWYVPYVIGAGLLGGLYKNWKQTIGDFITGCWLGAIVFFVR